MSQFNPQNHSFQEISTCFRRKLTVWPGEKIAKEACPCPFREKGETVLELRVVFQNKQSTENPRENSFQIKAKLKCATNLIASKVSGLPHDG